MAKDKPTATKKSAGGKKKSEAPKSQPAAENYSCQKPPPEKLNLREMLEKLAVDEDFRRFVRELLCRANAKPNKPEGKATRECLAKWYEPDDRDLRNLCIPAALAKAKLACTDRDRLLEGVSYSVELAIQAGYLKTGGKKKATK